MKLVSTPRIEFLRGLAGEILPDHGRGRSIVAIDGTDGSGRAAFADDLAAVLEERGHPTFRASLRYFQRSHAQRHAFGPDSPERLYRHGYDYSALGRVLIGPFRLGGSTGFVTQEFDPERDAWIEPTWLTAPADATLVVDGDFVHRPELRDLWSYSVLLDGDPETDADRLYRAEVDPRELASAVVDNTYPSEPRRLFLDGR